MDKPKGSWKNNLIFDVLSKILFGALIGIGAVLPGVSGGVLCVIFGIYPTVMELISHPTANLGRKLYILWPYGVGFVLGFWGIAKALDAVLGLYEDAAVCLFVGLVLGMLPSLFALEECRARRLRSYVSLSVSCTVVLIVLIILRLTSVHITANAAWYLLCGAAIAISVIVPGMSFSTLLMPLDLYAPLVEGIADFDLSVIVPACVGAAVTFFALARLVSLVFEKYYSVAQSAVIGVVIGATAAIIPYGSFFNGIDTAVTNFACTTLGLALAYLFSRFNKKFGAEEKKRNETKLGDRGK